MRTYVLDTSVLLSDPRAILRFDEHAVVLPVVVITELESKRHDPELGYFARTALRLLDGLRERHGRLDRPVPLNDEGGTLRVELNGTDDRVLPAGMRLGDNDTRILAVAVGLANAGADVTVVSKDMPMRIKASSVGLTADEYRAHLAPVSGYTGMSSLSVGAEELDALWSDGALPLDRLEPGDADRLAAELDHTGLTVSSPRASALATVVGDEIRIVRPDREVFGVHGRSAEQRVAIDHLLNPDVGIVSLGGRAGTGESALALAAVFDAVVNRREHRKVMVFRPLYAVGGQTLGFLPGDTGEKMQPWADAVFDTLSSVVPIDRLDRIAQRDNLRVGRWDGIASVIESLRGNPLFAHVDLVRTERSEIAELVTRMLDAVPLY